MQDLLCLEQSWCLCMCRRRGWGSGGQDCGYEVGAGRPRGKAWGHSFMLKGSGSPRGCQPGSDRVALEGKEEDHLSTDGQVCMRALGGWGSFQGDLRVLKEPEESVINNQSFFFTSLALTP